MIVTVATRAGAGDGDHDETPGTPDRASGRKAE